MSPTGAPDGGGFSLGVLLWRLFAVALGWLAAVLVSIAVLATAAATAMLPATRAFVEAPDAALTSGFSVLVTRMLGAVALGPTLIEIVWPIWLVAACLAEVAGTRSLLVHLVGAAAIAVGGLVATPPAPDAASVQLILAAGLVAGFTHWLVAGRSAGLTAPASRRPDGGGDPRSPHA